jgi:hypothetical protein
MPITVTREDERRRFTAIGKGPLSAEEILVFMAGHRVGEYRPYAMLLDVTEATFEVTVEDMHAFASRGDALRTAEGPRGPVAIVASRPGVFGLSRMYETLAEIKDLPPVRVFHTTQAADEWLATVGRSR